jgi:hypothetical protein
MSFTARHEASDSDAAASLLHRLETFRDGLAGRFGETPWGVAVVIHSRPLALALAHPWLPLARLAAAPAARRYMAGWFTRTEIHVLAPGALRARASRVPGSLEALRLSPFHEYAHLVLGANNRDLPPPFTPGSFRTFLRWAWLCEGAATHFSGQTRHLRAAVARRLKEGPRPALPPSTRDAQLLGGTVFDLLRRRRGDEACVELSSRLDEDGPGRALERAFGRALPEVEHDWQGWLRDYAAG